MHGSWSGLPRSRTASCPRTRRAASRNTCSAARAAGASLPCTRVSLARWRRNPCRGLGRLAPEDRAGGRAEPRLGRLAKEPALGSIGDRRAGLDRHRLRGRAAGARWTEDAHRRDPAAPGCARRLPPRDGAELSPQGRSQGRWRCLGFPIHPLDRPGVELFSTWRTTLAGSPAAGLAYRWRGIVVVQYAVSAEVIRGQPDVGEALRGAGFYVASDQGEGVVAVLANGSGTLLMADAPVEELRRLLL